MTTLEPFKVEIAKRLEKVRNDSGTSTAEFASTLKVSEEVYSAYLTGEVQIPMTVMRTLYDVHQVNPAWLLAGEEEQYMPKEASPAE